LGVFLKAAGRIFQQGAYADRAQVKRQGVNISHEWKRAQPDDGADSGKKSEGGRDDSVTGPDIQGHERCQNGIGAGG